ncbi:hypothetical protein ACNQKP_17860 [Bdellovibrio bacteriovorus]|uniref:hypothetical protein n=1 Tax=Bdellovibrio bacteriovorus TaxID=959 RepID=UPI003AA7D0F2
MRVLLLNVLIIGTALLSLGCTLEANISGHMLPSLLRPDGGDEVVDAPQISQKICANGPVFSQAQMPGGETILAGDFSRIGPCTSPFLKYNPATGAVVAVGPLDAAVGEAHVIVADGNGGYYVGGKFVAKNGNQSLLHIKADGTLSDWNPNIGYGSLEPTVMALKIQDDILYVGGEFSTAGSPAHARSSLAAFDLATGELASWAPPLTDDATNELFVNSIETTAGSVFIAGAFGAVGANAHVSEGIAKLNLSDNNADTAFVATGRTAFSGKLKLHNGTLLAVDGGAFVMLSSSTGAETVFMAGITTVPVWGGLADYELHGNELWVGGMFDSVNGHPTRNLVKFNFSGGTPVLDTSWATIYEPEGWVSIMKVTDSHILSFTNGVVGYWNKSNGTQYIPSVASPVGDAVYKAALTEGEDLLFVHTSKTLGIPETRYLAMYDAEGELLPWHPNPNDYVKSVVVHDSRIFVGGRFTDIGATPSGKDYLVEIDAAGEVTSWNADANDEITDMRGVQGSLLVAGEFTEIGSDDMGAAYLAKLSFADATGLPWTSQVDGRILGFDIDGTELIIGGGFSMVDGQAVDHLAKVDLSTGNLMGGTPTVNNWVNGVAIVNGKVYIYGQFTDVGGEARSRLAAFNLSDGSVTSWAPTIVVWAYRALRKVSDKLVVMAHFNTVEGVKYADGTLVLDPVTGAKTTDPRGIYSSTVWFED